MLLSRVGRAAARRAGALGASRRLHAAPVVRDVNRKEEVEYVAYEEAGHRLLESPIYNQGSAFTIKERDELGLRGLLPAHVETLGEQMQRAYEAYKHKPTDLERHIYLRMLQETNEVLFYALMQKHIVEFLPILYTPTVGLACRKFSQIFRRPRGLFLSYPHREHMTAIFKDLVARGWTGAPTDVDTRLDVRVIVATDGGRILGLGDLGVNGMGISIGKTSLYTGIGGIPGQETLPVMLDVGTDNAEILNDPNYLGWRHERLKGDEYFAFIDQFVTNVKRFFPDALLQWEDLNIDSAQPVLSRYRDELCTFNDDIQGTAAVTVGTLLGACKRTGCAITDQNVVIVGSGSAGCGIAGMIKKAMEDAGLSPEEAASRFFMIDKIGLLHDGIEGLRDFQQPFAQAKANLKGWAGGNGVSYTLEEVMDNAKPGILIGVSGVPGLFTEAAIRKMTANSAPRRPIIFPLSNPTERAEATPAQVMEWSGNSAIIATGTAFPATEVVTWHTKYKRTVHTHVHTQCNNSYIFPGIGLGCKVVRATRVTDAMLMASAKALASITPEGEDDPLLPALDCVHHATYVVATAVAKQAIQDGVARSSKNLSESELRALVEATFWVPRYKNIRIDSAMWSS